MKLYEPLEIPDKVQHFVNTLEGEGKGIKKFYRAYPIPGTCVINRNGFMEVYPLPFSF